MSIPRRRENLQVRESVVERYLLKRVKERKGKCLKLQIRTWPDRLVIFDHALIYLVEVKKPRGSVFQPLQERTLRWLAARGFQVYVLYSTSAVDTFIERHYASA
jgi:hypothetical protein